MRPVAQADGHDGARLVDQLVPGVAAVVEDILAGPEYPVGEPVVAYELPDVFGRIEFGRFGSAPITPAKWCSRRIPPRRHRPEPPKTGQADPRSGANPSNVR